MDEESQRNYNALKSLRLRNTNNQNASNKDLGINTNITDKLSLDFMQKNNQESTPNSQQYLMDIIHEKSVDSNFSLPNSSYHTRYNTRSKRIYEEEFCDSIETNQLFNPASLYNGDTQTTLNQTVANSNGLNFNKDHHLQNKDKTIRNDNFEGEKVLIDSHVYVKQRKHISRPYYTKTVYYRCQDMACPGSCKILADGDIFFIKPHVSSCTAVKNEDQNEPELIHDAILFNGDINLIAGLRLYQKFHVNREGQIFYKCNNDPCNGQGTLQTLAIPLSNDKVELKLRLIHEHSDFCPEIPELSTYFPQSKNDECNFNHERYGVIKQPSNCENGPVLSTSKFGNIEPNTLLQNEQFSNHNTNSNVHFNKLDNIQKVEINSEFFVSLSLLHALDISFIPSNNNNNNNVEHNFKQNTDLHFTIGQTQFRVNNRNIIQESNTLLLLSQHFNEIFNIVDGGKDQQLLKTTFDFITSFKQILYYISTAVFNAQQGGTIEAFEENSRKILRLIDCGLLKSLINPALEQREAYIKLQENDKDCGIYSHTIPLHILLESTFCDDIFLPLPLATTASELRHARISIIQTPVENFFNCPPLKKSLFTELYSKNMNQIMYITKHLTCDNFEYCKNHFETANCNKENSDIKINQCKEIIEHFKCRDRMCPAKIKVFQPDFEKCAENYNKNENEILGYFLPKNNKTNEHSDYCIFSKNLMSTPKIPRNSNDEALTGMESQNPSKRKRGRPRVKPISDHGDQAKSSTTLYDRFIKHPNNVLHILDPPINTLKPTDPLTAKESRVPSHVTATIDPFEDAAYLDDEEGDPDFAPEPEEMLKQELEDFAQEKELEEELVDQFGVERLSEGSTEIPADLSSPEGAERDFSDSQQEDDDNIHESFQKTFKTKKRGRPPLYGSKRTKTTHHLPFQSTTITPTLNVIDANNATSNSFNISNNNLLTPSMLSLHNTYNGHGQETYISSSYCANTTLNPPTQSIHNFNVNFNESYVNQNNSNQNTNIQTFIILPDGTLAEESSIHTTVDENNNILNIANTENLNTFIYQYDPITQSYYALEFGDGDDNSTNNNTFQDNIISTQSLGLPDQDIVNCPSTQNQTFDHLITSSLLNQNSTIITTNATIDTNPSNQININGMETTEKTFSQNLLNTQTPFQYTQSGS